MTNAAENLDLVVLNLHPPATPVSVLTPLEIAIDLRYVDRQTRGQPFNDRDQRATVRFSGGGEPQHLFRLSISILELMLPAFFTAETQSAQS